MSDEESLAVGRSIHIGRDATGNVNISGNGNVVVFEGTRFHPAEEPTAPPAADIGKNPYMGLLAFHETEADRFFGREEQTARLWEALRDLHSHVSGKRPPRLLPILGPSGSGKSSLARAGLMAELAHRPLPGMRSVRVGVMTPGAHPVEALAAVLARVATNDPTPVAKTTELEAALKRPNDDGEYDGLRRIADALPEIAGAPLIVLIDQFEEIYSLCSDRSDRTLFIDNLMLAARDDGGHVSVVITLRTDFFGETQTHEALNNVICKHHVMVPAMNEEELRQAIARPAQEAGYPLDEATITLLLNDTRGRDGTLPLLQFALTRIWDGLANGVEPAVTYREIGGVGGALAGEAQRIYQSLNDQEKRIAKRVFLGLVQLGEGTRDTRRRANVKSLIGVGDDPKHVERVIRRFSAHDARLITLSADERGGPDSAEVTHEALFDHWDQLSSWVDDSRDDVRFKQRLDDVAVNWSDRGHPEGALWRPPDLDLLTQFHGRAAEDMTSLQMNFFNASKAAESLRLETKQRDDRRLRRRTVMATSGAIVAFLLLGASIILLIIAMRSASNEMRARERLADAVVFLADDAESHFQEALDQLRDGEQRQVEDLIQTTRESIETFRALHGEDPTDPALSRALSIAYRRLGDAQGGRMENQGDTQAALDSYRTALAILEDAKPPSDGITRDLASAKLRIGDVLNKTGDVSGAAAEYKAAVDALDSLMRKGYPVGRTLAVALSSAGDALRHAGSTEEGDALLTRSWALRERLALAAPDNFSAQLTLAKGLLRESDQRRGAGDYEAALGLIRRSLGIRERLLEGDPDNPKRKDDVAVTDYFLALTFLGLNQPEQAMTHAQEWLVFSKESALAIPDDATAPRNLSAAYELRGTILADQGKWDEALILYQDMKEVIDQLWKSNPANTQYGRLLASSYVGLGEAALATDDFDSAVREFRGAFEIIEPMSVKDPANTQIKSARASVESALGEALVQNGKTDEALTHLASARERYGTLFAKDPAIVDYRDGLVSTLRRLAKALHSKGDSAAAIERVNEAIVILDGAVETAATREQRDSLEEDLEQYQREPRSNGQ